MAALNDRQRTRAAELIADARRLGALVPSPLESYGWTVTYQDETRPGRGHDVSAVWCDGEYLVQITLDPYGRGTLGVADVQWIHNSDDEECGCELCTAERQDETR